MSLTAFNQITVKQWKGPTESSTFNALIANTHVREDFSYSLASLRVFGDGSSSFTGGPPSSFTWAVFFHMEHLVCELVLLHGEPASEKPHSNCDRKLSGFLYGVIEIKKMEEEVAEEEADLPVQKELMFSHSGRWLDERKSDGQPIVIVYLSLPKYTWSCSKKMESRKHLKPIFIRPSCSWKVREQSISEHAVIIAGCHLGRREGKKKGKEAATSVL